MRFLDVGVEMDLLSGIGVLQQIHHGATLMLLEEVDDAHKVKEESEARVLNIAAISSCASALEVLAPSQNVDRSIVGDHVRKSRTRTDAAEL